MKPATKFRLRRTLFVFISLLLCLCIVTENSRHLSWGLKSALTVALLLAVGSWCLHAHVQSLRSGNIYYRGTIYDRETSPLWYWVYTATAGIVGLGFLVSIPLLLIFVRTGYLAPPPLLAP